MSAVPVRSTLGNAALLHIKKKGAYNARIMQSDEMLVAAYFEGDEDSFTTLAKRHLDAAYSFALRLTGSKSEAEDIVQESFLKAWKNLKRFDSHKAGFKTWLMRLVRNTTIDALRRKKDTPLSLLDDDSGDASFADTVADDSPLPDEIAARKGDVKALEAALGKLSPLHREILLLYHNNDFSFEEIASIAGESRNTIKSRYRRAIQTLQEALQMHPNG